MSWTVSGPNFDYLTMTEGDFGNALKINLKKITISQNDSFDFVIVDQVHGTEIVKKTFTDVTGGAVYLELTAAESALLPVGVYFYRIDWYQGAIFMNNLSRIGVFEVVVKA